MSKCTMRTDVTTNRIVRNNVHCTGYKWNNKVNETLEHKIQNQYNKLNTQTIASCYSRIFITEMFASQWQQFFKQISACKFPPDVLKMPPLGILIRCERSPLWATTPLGLLHLVQRGWDWAGPQPSLAPGTSSVPRATAHRQRPVYQSPYCRIMSVALRF